MMQKIFFNHIPKTAGTTLISLLNRNYPFERIMPAFAGMGWQNLVKDELIVDTYRYDLICSHVNIRSRLSDEWKTITFLRDPLRRLISLHNHWRSWTDQEIDAADTPVEIKMLKKKVRQMSLAEVLQLDHPFIRFQFVNGMAKHLIAEYSVVDLNKMAVEELTALAKKSLDSMFMVGISERFQESLFMLSCACAFPFEEQVQNLNERQYDLPQNMSLQERACIENAIAADRVIYEYGAAAFNERYKKLLVDRINRKANKMLPLLIKEKRKLYHVHIPKTAGTTTNKVLDKFYASSEIWPSYLMAYLRMSAGLLQRQSVEHLDLLEGSNVYKRKLSRLRRLVSGDKFKNIWEFPFNKIFNMFSLYHDHTNFSNLISSDWKKVVFFREPESRLRSHFHDWHTLSLRSIEDSLDAEELKSVKKQAAVLSFGDFFKLDSKYVNNNFRNLYLYYLLGNDNERLRKTSAEEDLFKIAVDKLNSYFFVGIVEDYFNSMALLHYKMRWPFTPDIETLNKRTYGRHRDVDSQEDKSSIEPFIRFDRKIYDIACRRYYQDLGIMFKELSEEAFRKESPFANEQEVDVIDMQGRILGTGWHEREGMDIGRIYRWSGPQRTSQLYFKCPDHEVICLKFFIISSFDRQNIDGLKVSLNGRAGLVEYVGIADGYEIVNVRFIAVPKRKMAILEMTVPQTHAHADHDPEQLDKRQKGIAIRRIEIHPGVKDGIPVLLCSSLGDKCGISTYTQMLAEGQKLLAVRTLKDLNGFVPAYIHVQHEFGIYSAWKMFEIIDFCRKNKVRLYVTLHTILPEESLYSLGQSFFHRVHKLLTRNIFVLDDFMPASWLDQGPLKHWCWQMKEGLKYVAWKTKDGVKHVIWRIKEPVKHVCWRIKEFLKHVLWRMNKPVESLLWRVKEPVKHVCWRIKEYVKHLSWRSREVIKHICWRIKEGIKHILWRIKEFFKYLLWRSRESFNQFVWRPKEFIKHIVWRIKESLKFIGWRIKESLKHVLWRAKEFIKSVVWEICMFFNLKRFPRVYRAILPLLDLQKRLKSQLRSCWQKSGGDYISQWLSKDITIKTDLGVSKDAGKEIVQPLVVLPKEKGGIDHIGKADPLACPGLYVHFRDSHQAILKYADKIIVHSQEAKDELLRQECSKVEVFPHPLKEFVTSNTLHSHKDGRIHVGFFGFFNKDKSIDQIIEACQGIPNVCLHIYSSMNVNNQSSSYYHKICDLIKKNPWIEFSDRHITLDEAVFFLSQCDVNVWYTKPIKHFSTTGSIRQYLAAKRPVVARDNRMITDLKGIITIVPSDDIEALRFAIQHYDPDISKIAEYVRTHTWDKLSIKYD